MYFSKWLLDSRKPIDPYQLHKKIWQLFPDKADEERSFLFRVEKTGQRCTQCILVQSACLPQSASNELLLLKGPKEVHFELKSGGRYRFMLCANPTKRINDKDGKAKNQGKVRVPLIDEAETVAWLKRQFEGSAEIDAVELIQKNLIHFRKSNKDKNHFGKIQTVTFLGMLTVIDSELLIGKIVKGIGPAKAFGCGLVTLAKI
ncbi:type I-E CRISPR-associated protein Cas6/Cse3/CasE [Methanosarcina barkeri]|uniref:CRISPR-associated protein, Cse3 family n=1 Tax=Methanosarcina barkeri 227 TaxID=1434106 RepID=A0A0E3R3T6_METBA|nr:type I-E CRISPR-associated protein Cas6/Cse3/CasE [Methanosarcina barkeri]AKB58142.1 CRISPR-associated protein, Cse3 family [Methanosarcina barkeri 227]